jgi:hypothetical protein
MAPASEESRYVVFSGTAGEKPGFWYEDPWGACNCMLLHKNVAEACATRVQQKPRLHSLQLVYSRVLFMLTE